MNLIVKHGFRHLGIVLVAVLIVGSGGCASTRDSAGPGAVTAAASDNAVSDIADEALSMMTALGSDDSGRLSDGTGVTAAAAYKAASGRTCRHVRLTGGAHLPARRLACEEGGQWAWYPNVLP